MYLRKLHDSKQALIAKRAPCCIYISLESYSKQPTLAQIFQIPLVILLLDRFLYVHVFYQTFFHHHHHLYYSHYLYHFFQIDFQMDYQMDL